MPDYRIYELDEYGHVVVPPKIVTCRDDNGATEHAKAVLDGGNVEVWDLDRLVTRLPKCK